MTERADFKSLVRERMARTGERYTTARAHLLATHPEAHPERYPDSQRAPALVIGGEHDQTAALRDLLVAAGLDAPHTSQPPTEALLLGLGGGLGAAVFTFNYSCVPHPQLYIETRCTPQYAYDLAFIRRATEALGLRLAVSTGTTPRAAARALDAALAAGRPAICVVDANALPHHGGARELGAIPWVVVVHEVRGDDVVITDRSRVTFEMSRRALDEARAAFAKGKGAVAVVEGDAIGDLRPGVRAGVAHCVAELAGREVKKGFGSNFGLRSLEKWIGEVEARGKKGWRTTFAPGAPLAAGLRQAFHWVETSGTGGGGFRRLYADFLREGATIAGDARFGEVAKRYDALAGAWTTLFTSLLPDGTPLGAMRRLLLVRAEGVRSGDPRERLQALDQEMQALVDQCAPFPVDAEETYVALAEGLRALVAAERDAAASLRELATG